MVNFIENIKSKTGFIIDMDGVIYHGNKLLPGVNEFLAWMENSGKKYLFLTNASERTPKELLENHGILTAGETLLQTFDKLQELENAAKMTLIVDIKEKKRMLSPSRICESDRLFR
jgi:ribonucleotide monophosphatase NagD (HAD superfamily)